jgi:LTXXQ motif family protein
MGCRRRAPTRCRLRRLQAMEKRLSAMLQAANQMQPALDDFYASLTTEQKARFNTLQQVAGQ